MLGWRRFGDLKQASRQSFQFTNSIVSTSKMNRSQNMRPYFYSEFFMNWEQCDIVIKCEEEQLPCHSTILKDRSSFFKVMLESGMKECHERVIVIEDAKAETVKTMIKYLYCNEIPEIFAFEDLIIMADKYDLPGLIQMVIDRLLNRLKKGDRSILKAVNMLEDEDLKKSFLLRVAFAMEELKMPLDELCLGIACNKEDVEYIKHCSLSVPKIPWVRRILAVLLKLKKECREDIKKVLINEILALPVTPEIEEILFHGIENYRFTENELWFLTYKCMKYFDESIIKTFLRYLGQQPTLPNEMKRKSVRILKEGLKCEDHRLQPTRVAKVQYYETVGQSELDSQPILFHEEICFGLVMLGVFAKDKELVDACTAKLMESLRAFFDLEICKVLLLSNCELIVIDSVMKYVVDSRYRFLTFKNEDAYRPLWDEIVQGEGYRSDAARLIESFYEIKRNQNRLRREFDKEKRNSSLQESEIQGELLAKYFGLKFKSVSLTFKQLVFGQPE